MNQLIAVLNGPNLNLLGERDPAIYGRVTLEDIEKLCLVTADELGYDVDFRQTNHEGALIDSIHELRSVAAGIVINAAAYTHTSIAIHDALATVRCPIVEVHLSDIHAREPYRHRSFVSDLSEATITGKGAHGYELAIRHVDHLVKEL